MIRATSVRRAEERASHYVNDTVVLDFDGRRRRRVAMTGERGLRFLLDLPEVNTLREGDELMLEDGRLVLVKSAPERLLEIRATDLPSLMRIAWHLGNRHLPTQLLGERLRIREDHVIASMVRGLGGTVEHVEAPFDPEGGAYGHGQVHGHSHVDGDAAHHRPTEDHHDESHHQPAQG